MLCEVTSGDDKGFRVCETCLEKGDIEQQILAHAERMESGAMYLRAIAASVEVPTFEQWKEENERVENERARAHFNSDEEYMKWLEDNKPVVTEDAPF